MQSLVEPTFDHNSARQMGKFIVNNRQSIFGTPGSRPVSLGDTKEMEITELHNYTKGMPMSQKSQPELKGENGNKQHNFQTSSLNRNSGAEPF